MNCREAYRMHASNGILFNHEGPTRGETFVTRKISRAVAAIELNQQDRIYLGNLDARRDRGHARDYVEGMWLMLQQPKPDDYVLAKGEDHSIREFVEKAFACIGRSLTWEGEGAAECGIETGTSRALVEIDPRYYRLTEVEFLLSDPAKAGRVLGSQHRVGFDALVKEMAELDPATLRAETRRRNSHD